MTDHQSPTIRPLLFLDVDGTLLPLGNAASDVDKVWGEWQAVGNPRLRHVERTHGPRLLALGCELIWATGWMHDANVVIAPLLGLPQLPVAALPDWESDQLPDGLHWKTRVLVELADGRPFVWLDDEFTADDEAWVSTNHPGPALLHHVDPGRGLSGPDLTTVEVWLATVLAAG